MRTDQPESKEVRFRVFFFRLFSQASVEADSSLLAFLHLLPIPSSPPPYPYSSTPLHFTSLRSTQPVRYIFARNYELAGTGAALAKGTELALIICEADEGDVKPEEGGKRKRGKGAYFHEFISKTTIKRKRIKVSFHLQLTLSLFVLDSRLAKT